MHRFKHCSLHYVLIHCICTVLISYSLFTVKWEIEMQSTILLLFIQHMAHQPYALSVTSNPTHLPNFPMSLHHSISLASFAMLLLFSSTNTRILQAKCTPPISIWVNTTYKCKSLTIPIKWTCSGRKHSQDDWDHFTFWSSIFCSHALQFLWRYINIIFMFTLRHQNISSLANTTPDICNILKDWFEQWRNAQRNGFYSHRFTIYG